MGRRRKFFLFCLCLALGGRLYAQSDRLQIFGFFDLEAEVGNQSRTAKYFSFDQHHLNFITIFRLDQKTRLFSEIEWEHGPSHKDGEMAGKIYMARAFLEYKYSDAALFRAGKFLPPFGIYNEMHDAAPAFLSTVLPFSVYGEHLDSAGRKTRLYAKYATGIWLLGSVPLHDWTFQYNFYFGNGRGRDPAEKDDNPDKGLGWRFLLTSPEQTIKIGTSYYRDRNGLSFSTRQRALDFDAEIRWKNLIWQTEFFLPRGEKVDAQKRPNGRFRSGRAYYILAGYTLGDIWTPFIRRDYYDPDISSPDDAEFHHVFGLNLAVTDRIYLKAEIHRVRFQATDKNGYEKFLASAAVAF